MGQRRVPGAEVVERQPDAQLAELREDVERALRVGHQRVLGELEHERALGHAVAAEHLGDVAGERGVEQVGDGDVDGDLQRRCRPCATPPAGPAPGAAPAASGGASARAARPAAGTRWARASRGSGCCQRTSASTPVDPARGELDLGLEVAGRARRARSRRAAGRPARCARGCGGPPRGRRPRARSCASWTGTSRCPRGAAAPRGPTPCVRRDAPRRRWPARSCAGRRAGTGASSASRQPARRAARRRLVRAGGQQHDELVAAEAAEQRAGAASPRRSRPANSLSSSSPAAWPSVSLSSLKRSRSISRSATGRPPASAWAICSSASW